MPSSSPMCAALAALLLAMSAGVQATATSGEDTACVLCVLLVNEVEGLMSEGASESAMEAALRVRVCAALDGGVGRALCDAAVAALPTMIAAITNEERVGPTCMRLHMCVREPSPGPDMIVVPAGAVVRLDAPPATRWRVICGTPAARATFARLLAIVGDLLSPTRLAELTSWMRTDVMPLFGDELAAELEGCASAGGVDPGLCVVPASSSTLRPDASDARSLVFLTPACSL